MASIQPDINSLAWKYYIARRNIKGTIEHYYLKSMGFHNNEHTISFCTVVMDRFEHLQQTFLRNIEDNSAYPDVEFVLLNYNCPDTRMDNWVKSELQSFLEKDKVCYYRFEDGSSQFRPSHARNLAFQLAHNEIVCNIDADNFTGEGFAEYISTMFRRKSIFLRGPIDRRGIAGRICCLKKDWERAGGYDERFTYWGVEDSDLDGRLQLLGLQKKTILQEKFCNCILHSNEMRAQNYPVDIKTSYHANKQLEYRNRKEKTVNPNGSQFGKGRVQKNFSEWIEV